MYLPSHFTEERAELLRELIREHPLGALVTLAAGGLSANHIPFEFDAEPAPLGTLRCHVARANPIWRDFSPAVEALAIFQGPKAYVSPSLSVEAGYRRSGADVQLRDRARLWRDENHSRSRMAARAGDAANEPL